MVQSQKCKFRNTHFSNGQILRPHWPVPKIFGSLTFLLVPICRKVNFDTSFSAFEEYGLDLTYVLNVEISLNDSIQQGNFCPTIKLNTLSLIQMACEMQLHCIFDQLALIWFRSIMIARLENQFYMSTTSSVSADVWSECAMVT